MDGWVNRIGEWTKGHRDGCEGSVTKVDAMRGEERAGSPGLEIRDKAQVGKSARKIGRCGTEYNIHWRWRCRLMLMADPHAGNPFRESGVVLGVRGQEGGVDGDVSSLEGRSNRTTFMVFDAG